MAVLRFHAPFGLMAITDEPWTLGMDQYYIDIYTAHVICMSAITNMTTMRNEVASHVLNVCRICAYVTDSSQKYNNNNNNNNKLCIR
jgi:hypothetical protein